MSIRTKKILLLMNCHKPFEFQDLEGGADEETTKC